MDINILLVDDEADFVETLTKRFRIRKIQVASASNGPDALKLLEGQEFDVAILDVRMPGMDGMELLRAIRARHPLTEVIMLTGHATVENAIEGMKRGAFDYLMKPCNLEDLIRKIEQAATKKFKHEEKIMEARAKEITGRMV